MNFAEQRKAKREARLAKYKAIEEKGFVEIKPDTRKGKSANKVFACFPCEKLYPRYDGDTKLICTTCKQPCIAETDTPGKDFFKVKEKEESGYKRNSVQIVTTVRSQQLSNFTKRLAELREDGKYNFILNQHQQFFPKEEVPEGTALVLVELKVHYFLYIESLLEKGLPVPPKVRANYNAACAYKATKLSTGLRQLLVADL